MKVFVCLALIASVALAEPPAYRQNQQNRYFIARQEAEPASGPYPARGWRPDGPAFNLPQRQQQAPDNGYGAPAQPPQNQYGPPAQQPDNQYGPPQKFGRQQQLPQNQYGAPAQQPENQYGAPNGQQERYRAAKQQQPRQQYGPPPQNQYGPPAQQPPQNQYGPPSQGQYPAPSAPFPSSTEYPLTEQEQPTTVAEFGENEAESSTPASNEFEEEQDIDQPQQGQQQRAQNLEQGQYYVALPDGRLQRVQYVSRQDLEAMRYFAKIKAENVEPLRGPIYAYAPLKELEVAPGQLQVAPVAPSSLTITASEKRPQKLQSPKLNLEIKPLAQVQYQHDNQAPAAVVPLSIEAPSSVVPLSSSYTTFTANYAQQVPATVPVEDRYILAFP